ncbi:hypothetical protein RHMOL_Rhmol06G0204600 [Rhododendron molle]|uniref:Uncharacterized protein n=1 Tax=Rhododendron molle TaxID=49168 RepID=A0ACC0NEM3_RHOML|nr:hypothetical protein RHMOL_Rhmol06G0204600 [Rhododendron molle]
MASNSRWFYVILFALLTGLASSTFIPGDVFQSHGYTARALLQAKTACTVDFEHQNYTIITSQCKGPNFQAGPCCTALKEFACPYSVEISNEKSDCASTMFSYINAMGNYPPALFSSLCVEGKQGLDCGNFTSTKTSVNNGATPMPMMLTASFFMLLFHLF